MGVGVGVNMMVRGLERVACHFRLHLSLVQLSYMNDFVHISSERPTMRFNGISLVNKVTSESNVSHI